MKDIIPVDVLDGDLDARDVLLQSSDSAGDSVGRELGGEGLPVNVGRGIGVSQDCEQDLAISLGCDTVSETDMRRADLSLTVPSDTRHLCSRVVGCWSKVSKFVRVDGFECGLKTQGRYRV